MSTVGYPITRAETKKRVGNTAEPMNNLFMITKTVYAQNKQITFKYL